jgi:hypothetical protein
VIAAGTGSARAAVAPSSAIAASIAATVAMRRWRSIAATIVLLDRTVKVRHYPDGQAVFAVEPPRR